MTEDEVESITNSMEMSLSKLWKLVMDRGACCATVLWVTNTWTEQLNCTCVGDRKSILSQIGKDSGLPKVEKGVWIVEEEMEGSGILKEEKRTKMFVCWLFVFLYIPIFSIFLSLSHIKCPPPPLYVELMITQQTTQFKLCNWDYIAPMYHA